MNLLVWNPDWETGFQLIDDQHRELFERVDALMSAIHANDAKDAVPGVLTYLTDYVAQHFREEEAEMAASHYPGMAQHCQIHEEMRTKVATMMLQFQSDPTCITDDVLEFITEWLVVHINGVDRQMARHLIAWAASHPAARG